MICKDAKQEMDVLVFQWQYMELIIYNLRGFKSCYRPCEMIPLFFLKPHLGFGNY